MTSTSKKRKMLDIKLLKEMDVNLEVISLNNIQCDIKGPKDTPYENGKWKLNINFPENYPYKSPSIGFLDAIYHPNIDLNSGTICLKCFKRRMATNLYFKTYFRNIYSSIINLSKSR